MSTARDLHKVEEQAYLRNVGVGDSSLEAADLVLEVGVEFS